MEPVEVRDMLYILGVCEERSFSRAAEKYYISQPALSKIVKRVEGNLGAQIFDRSSEGDARRGSICRLLQEDAGDSSGDRGVLR